MASITVKKAIANARKLALGVFATLATAAIGNAQTVQAQESPPATATATKVASREPSSDTLPRATA